MDGWTDVQTYGRADGHLRPTLLGQLGGVDLKMVTLVLVNLLTVTDNDIQVGVELEHASALRLFCIVVSLVTHCHRKHAPVLQS